MTQSAVDPAVEAQLVEFFRTFRPPPGQSTVEFLRRADLVINADLPAVGAHHTGVELATGDDWRLRADISVPVGPGPFPVLLYLHGGAWTMGSPHTHRRLTHDLTAAGFVTVSLDYRRAPRFRFPAAIDDTAAARRWIHRHITGYGGDPARVAIAGDSAGATIAAGFGASTAGPDGGPPVGAALLLYGVFDYHAVIERLARPGEAPAGAQHYVDPADYDRLRGDPRLSPVLAAERFPPTYLVVGSEDPTVDQSRRLAEELARAGIRHELHVVERLPHGFLQLPHTAGHDDRIRAAAAFVLTSLDPRASDGPS